MHLIQRVRRFAALAGLAAGLVAFGTTPAFAMVMPPGWRRPRCRAAASGASPRRRHWRHARLADHPDRCRGCPTRGHGGGAPGSGTGYAPGGGYRGRLSDARCLTAQAEKPSASTKPRRECPAATRALNYLNRPQPPSLRRKKSP